MMDAAGAVAPYREVLGRSEPELVAGLEKFVALLRKWNATHNLVSRETADDLWTRHIADSLQVLKFLTPADRFILDLGSGGGFPAIPLAIASDELRLFWLVEPIAKKAAFLRAAGRELGLRLSVEQARAERIAVEVIPPIDVITSRALAPLATLLELSFPFFREPTRALFHKGREHVDELAESRAVWQFDVIEHPSDIAAGGVLLEISNLRVGQK
jgi:16S rRNA (guanine527-N7)-methyltransferase